MKLFFLLAMGLFFFAFPAKASFLNIQSLTTPRGIPVWYLVDKSQPIISLSFAFKNAGTSYDPKEKQGLVQLLASTLDEGAGPYDSRMFQEKLQNQAILLSFSATRDDFLGEIKTLSDSAPLAFSLLRLALSDPHLTNEAIDRMRHAHQSRLMQNKTDPDWQAARLMNDRLFEKTSYSMNSGGTLAGLKAVSRKDLLTFKNNFLTRDRLRVAVVGDIDPTTLGKIIDDLFSQLPEQAGGPLGSPQRIIHQNDGKTFTFEQDISQTILIKTLPAPDQKDPDEPAFAVMNYILGGGGFGSRLMDHIREESGLTYGIYSQIVHLERSDYLSIRTSTRNDQLPHLMNLLNTEIDRILSEPVRADELSAAKGFMLGSMASALTSTDKISAILLSLMIDNRPLDELDRRRKAIAAVREHDIQKVAQKWLKSARGVTILVGKPPPSFSTIPIKTLPGVEK